MITLKPITYLILNIFLKYLIFLHIGCPVIFVAVSYLLGRGASPTTRPSSFLKHTSSFIPAASRPTATTYLMMFHNLKCSNSTLFLFERENRFQFIHTHLKSDVTFTSHTIFERIFLTDLMAGGKVGNIIFLWDQYLHHLLRHYYIVGSCKITVLFCDYGTAENRWKIFFHNQQYEDLTENFEYPLFIAKCSFKSI